MSGHGDAHEHHHHHDFGDDYAGAIEERRHAKDHWFAASPDSPLPEGERGAFRGLAYYDPDPVYRVVALLVAHDAPATVVMPTSDGDQREFVNVGHFELELAGVTVDLQAYRGGDGELFLPFKDATSGKETYGAGRYLDLDWHGTGVPYVVDFNLAYNPTCAYDEAYACPFPPAENWLKVAIPAGEKTFTHGSG